MKLTYKVNGNCIEAALIGELDTPATIEVQDKFQFLIDNSEKYITVDCSRLEYIASSGLRMFIRLHKACNAAGGSMTLTNVSPDVMEILSITSFDLVFNIR